MGVRELGHPLQGLRPAGRAPRPVREGRRRRAGPPAHRARPVGRAAHPVGPRRRLRQAAPPRRGPRRPPRARSTPTRSRTTTTCSAACATSTSGCGPRRSRHALDCVDIMDVTGSRDLKVWLPDGLNYPGQADLRDRQDRLADSLAAGLRPPRRPPAPGARVQALRAGLLRHRRPRLGHGLRPLRRARRAGRGLPRHRPPRPGHEHRVHRHAAAAARPARRVRLQLPLLRRRRPDRRRRRPVPAVPHPVRGRAGRRLRRRQRRQLHARPVPQHRGQDPRPDPLGAQRPGDDGPGAARRPGRARRGRAGRRRARRQRAC